MMTTGIATPATGATRDEARKMKLPRPPPCRDGSAYALQLPQSFLDVQQNAQVFYEMPMRNVCPNYVYIGS
uniref:Uncharacterized protein n=1 Tax=Oryza glumipatula TaxID=40148 RepID=A0A0E0B5L2_9ORYZ